jgi:hypothetical protein
MRERSFGSNLPPDFAAFNPGYLNAVRLLNGLPGGTPSTAL